MTNATPPLWQTIQQIVQAEIAAGQYRAGDRLPTEASFAARFGVNRHTVRRALAALTAAGLVHSRQGSGAFVTARPADYPIGQRVRFHQNLRAAGRIPGKTVLALTTRIPDGAEAAALDLATGQRVHVYDGLSLADCVPIALFRSVFPAARFPSLLDDLAELSSVTAALQRAGVDDYTRASTRLTARSADTIQAGHLNLPVGAALLLSHSVNVDLAKRPVEYGQTWFSGERVTLTLDHG